MYLRLVVVVVSNFIKTGTVDYVSILRKVLRNGGFTPCVCVCIPILVTTFPEWLSGTEPLPHTPGAVRPSSGFTPHCLLKLIIIDIYKK